jgi:hypothetical protein
MPGPVKGRPCRGYRCKPQAARPRVGKGWKLRQKQALAVAGVNPVGVSARAKKTDLFLESAMRATLDLSCSRFPVQGLQEKIDSIVQSPKTERISMLSLILRGLLVSQAMFPQLSVGVEKSAELYLAPSLAEPQDVSSVFIVDEASPSPSLASLAALSAEVTPSAIIAPPVPKQAMGILTEGSESTEFHRQFDQLWLETKVVPIRPALLERDHIEGYCVPTDVIAHSNTNVCIVSGQKLVLKRANSLELETTLVHADLLRLFQINTPEVRPFECAGELLGEAGRIELLGSVFDADYQPGIGGTDLTDVQLEDLFLAHFVIGIDDLHQHNVGLSLGAVTFVDIDRINTDSYDANFLFGKSFVSPEHAKAGLTDQRNLLQYLRLRNVMAAIARFMQIPPSSIIRAVKLHSDCPALSGHARAIIRKQEAFGSFLSGLKSSEEPSDTLWQQSKFFAAHCIKGDHRTQDATETFSIGNPISWLSRKVVSSLSDSLDRVVELPADCANVRSFLVDYRDTIVQAAEKHGVDPAAIATVLVDESLRVGYFESLTDWGLALVEQNPSVGMAQIRPETLRTLAPELSNHSDFALYKEMKDPERSIDMCARKVRQIMRHIAFNGKLDCLFDSYHNGGIQRTGDSRSRYMVSTIYPFVRECFLG